MMKKKPKTVNLDSTMHIDGLMPIRAEEAVFEHFAGRGNGEVPYNKAGCRLNVECVLVRSYRADPFRLAVKIGDQWYELANIRADNPAIKKMLENGEITEYGPSPHEQEKQKQKEAEQQEREEAAKAYMRSRQEHHARIKRDAEAREQQARAERRAMMGY